MTDGEAFVGNQILGFHAIAACLESHQKVCLIKGNHFCHLAHVEQDLVG